MKSLRNCLIVQSIKMFLNEETFERKKYIISIYSILNYSVIAVTMQKLFHKGIGVTTSYHASSHSLSKTRNRVSRPYKHSSTIITHASIAGNAEIETIGGIRPEIDEAIKAALNNCLTETNLDIGKKYTVR